MYGIIRECGGFFNDTSDMPWYNLYLPLYQFGTYGWNKYVTDVFFTETQYYIY